ncbi:MAG TPA: signal peptidase II [Candidatus Aquilonibacter sp.]|nr:signal peptidase II [Candidatus Aquilonibacter sp.]
MSRHQTFNASLLIALAAIFAFVADQVTKYFVTSHMMYPDSIMVIPHLLKWTYERNTHGAFGLFGNNGLLLIVMAVVVLFIFWWSFRDQAKHSRLVCVAFGLIVGGAIGNIVDRVHLGYVVDFIDFYRIWPNIFNVGDSCITSGVILLLLSSLGRSRRNA